MKRYVHLRLYLCLAFACGLALAQAPKDDDDAYALNQERAVGVVPKSQPRSLCRSRQEYDSDHRQQRKTLPSQTGWVTADHVCLSLI